MILEYTAEDQIKVYMEQISDLKAALHGGSYI